MNIVPLRDTEQFKRGHSGELLVVDKLLQRGWHVIPSYDYAGEDEHPPRMEGQAATYILPDLDICRKGDRRWAEVKTKTGPCMGRISGELEHGIPLRHYEHYLAVERESGCPVYLFIYEEAARQLIYRKLDELGPGRVSNAATMSRGGMIYWLRRQFREFTFEPPAPSPQGELLPR
jgi:hypothetical protein